jgi:hypothetical protein
VAKHDAGFFLPGHACGVHLRTSLWIWHVRAFD